MPNLKVNGIELGTVVHDSLTEFEGTAIARQVYQYDCVSIAVLPKSLDGGKPAVATWLDEKRLKEYTPDATKYVSFGIQPGEQATDKISKIKGTVTAKCFYLYQAPRLNIATGNINPENGEHVTMSIDEEQAVEYDALLAHQCRLDAEKKAATPAIPRKPGGPGDMAPRAMMERR